MPRKFLLLLFLAAAIFAALKLPYKKMPNADALEALLVAAGAEVMEGEVQYYAPLEARYLSMDELEAVLLQAASLLGLEGGLLQRGEGETYRVLDVTGPISMGPQTHIIVQSNPGMIEPELPPQSYLLVVCRDSSVEKVKTVAERLEVILRPLAPGGRLSYYLEGRLPGRLDGEEAAKLARKALFSLGATVVEGLEEKDLVSLTAYTPLIDQYLAVEGTRFNLNLAVRYDSYRDATMLWAGTPVLHGSY